MLLLGIEVVLDLTLTDVSKDRSFLIFRVKRSKKEEGANKIFWGNLLCRS